MAPTSASPGGSPGPGKRTSGRVKATPTPRSSVTPSSLAGGQSEDPSSNSNIGPATGRSLRPRRESAAVYEISSDSDDKEDSDSEHEASDKDDEGEDNEKPQEEKEERGALSGRSLRPRGLLAAPSGLADYVDTNTALSNRKKSTKKRKLVAKKKKTVQKKRLPAGKACQACHYARRKCDTKKPRCGGCVRGGVPCVLPDAGDSNYPDDGGEDEVEYSVRSEIRKTLEETKRRRDAFYLQYRDLFEPLLPEKNYILKLVEKRNSGPPPHLDVAMNHSAQFHGKVESNGNGEIILVKAQAPVENGTIVEDSGVKFDIEVRNNAKTEDRKPNVVEAIKYPEVVPYQLLDKQPELYVSLAE